MVRRRSMSLTRSLQTATLLNNGKVLVSGGGTSNVIGPSQSFGYGNYLTSAELYDPASNTWSAAGSMTTARFNDKAVLLLNGMVLVTGGYNDTDGYVSSAELYSPISNTWYSAGFMASTRNAQTETLLANGSVLVTGGHNLPGTGYLFNAEKYTFPTSFANNKIYDATTSATLNLAGLGVVGVFSGDSVALLSGAATGMFVSKNVGNNIPVTTTGFAISGPQSSDYYLIQPTTIANITPAPLTLTAKTNTKTYDKTTTAALTPTVAGLKGSDTVTGLTESYNNANVGTNKTMSVNSGYTINDGNNGNNYSVFTAANSTGAITKALLTIAATTNTKTWDGTASATAVPTVTGLITGDSVSGLSEVYNDPNVGTGKILSVASGYSVNDGNSGQNYAVTAATNNTGVITAPNFTETITANTSVIEPPTGQTFTIYLTISVNQPLNYTVSYKTMNGAAGQAVSGTDYLGVNNGTAHLNNSLNTQSTVTIPITILGPAYEPPNGPTTKSFTVQLQSVVINGAGPTITQTLIGAPNSTATITIQEVFAPKVSISATQGPGLLNGSPYLNLTTYWPSNPNFTATQYAQGGGDVFLRYATTLSGSPFSSATIKITAANFVAASGTFYIPNFKLPSTPPAGMLTVSLTAITSNAIIDPLAKVGSVFYP